MQNLFAQPDSLTKYFSTTIMRTNVLKGKPEKTVDENEAHFKAVYYPSGELKSVEFLPANWDKKSVRRPQLQGEQNYITLNGILKLKNYLKG